jgi:hypothetical protein
VGTDTVNLIQTLGFPVVSAAAVGWFGYRVVFYVLRDMSAEIKNQYEITIKLIDATNNVRKEICSVEKRLAEIREQHRNFQHLLDRDGSGPRVHKSSGNKRG